MTDDFVQQVVDWIERSGEVLVVLRYLRAAGARDYALCRSRDEFEALVESVPIGCDTEVFREPQLSVRGVVSADFITLALDAIPDGAEYLVLTQERQPGSAISRYGTMGDSQQELRECLQELSGVEVALGVCPDFLVDDHAGLISASKGGIDGPR